MTEICIYGNWYTVPEGCDHVTVDRDGRIHAFQHMPTKGNDWAGCWLTGDYALHPGILIGDLHRDIPGWKDVVYLIV